MSPQSWSLAWEFGSAELQSLGGMLGPVRFHLGAERQLQLMHVASWANEARAASLPGLLQRLRGEWPCLPFGRTDPPTDLPPGWKTHEPDDPWPHGFGSNHPWTCAHADASQVLLTIDYPETASIARLERRIQVVADAPALDISLTVHARRSVVLPVGLHPTFRLPQACGQVRLELGEHEGIFSYPSRSAGAITRLLPNQRAEGLEAMPGSNGPMDLSRLPLPGDTEELLQVRGLRSRAGQPPLRLHYEDVDACVELSWDTSTLPDLMLWMSNRGRPDYPWQGQHIALGAEPVNSLFDLGRVATPPPDHPLADRRGIALLAGQPWTTHYRIAARSREAAAGG